MRSTVFLSIHMRPSHNARRRRGGSLLEMMLVLPVLLMLGFGVIDYGYYFYVRNTFQAAAAAGARAAAPSTATDATVTSLVSNMMSGAGLQNSGYQVTLSPSDVSTAAAGSTVTVTITATWGNCGTHMLGTAFGGIGNGQVILASASMLKGATVGGSSSSSSSSGSSSSGSSSSGSSGSSPPSWWPSWLPW